MKPTPLFVFFIILFLFLLVLILYKWTKGWANVWANVCNIEGFINYEQDKNPLSSVLIPPYSSTKPVIKMYDNLFLDQTNFNLIEVNGTAYNQGATIKGNIDDIGTSITNIFVVSPCSNLSCTAQSLSTNNTDFTLSQLQLPTLTNPWSYISQTPSSNTDTYQTFFIPVPPINTVISYIVNLTSFKSLMALKIQSQIEESYFISDPPFNSTLASPAVIDTDQNNGNMVTEPFYDPAQQVYQITTLIKYDYKTGNLLVKSNDGTSLSIYDYSKNQTISTSNADANKYIKNTTSNAFSPWTITDPNRNLIVYIPIDNEYTMILVLSLESNRLVLSKSLTFQKNIGVKIVNGTTPTPAITTTPSPPTTTPSPTPTTTPSPIPTTTPTPTLGTSISTGYAPTITPSTSNPISNYYSTPTPTSVIDMSDYVLKTSLIPPISCPDGICSTCTPSSNSGCCSSCGASTCGGVPINTLGTSTTQPPITPMPTLSFDISNIAQNLYNDVAKNLYQTFNLSNPYNDVKNGVDVLENGLSSVGNSLYNVGKSGVNTVDNAVGTVYSDSKNGIGAVGGAVGTVYSDSKNAVGTVYTDSKNAVGTIGSGIGNTVGTIGSGIGNTVGTIGSGIGNTVGTIGSGTIGNENGQSGRSSQNQRNQYYGKSSQTPDLSSQYGAQSGETSVFLPLTSDFSKFTR